MELGRNLSGSSIAATCRPSGSLINPKPNMQLPMRAAPTAWLKRLLSKLLLTGADHSSMRVVWGIAAWKYNARGSVLAKVHLMSN